MHKQRNHILFLLFLSVLLYFLGNGSLPISDPVEGNYTETAKEMLASGDYLSPQIFGNYWYDKPILFYLELIASFQIFGLTDFAARFAPAVGTTLSILLTYFFGRHLYGERTGFVAALLTATSVEFWYIGHAVITDMTLFLTISLTLIAFYIGYKEQKPRWYLLAFFAAGVATLDKGPLGLCLPGLIILIFLITERRLGALLNRCILFGFVLYFATIALWYLPMYQLHGADFLDTFFGVHNALRATVPEHPRNSVWYFYLMVFFLGCLPWSLAGLPAAVSRIYHRKVSFPKDTTTRFLLVWAITVFVVFECFASKYVTYTMPYLMPLALLAARYFVQHEKLTARVAGGMAVFYVIAVFFIAPYFLVHNSARDAGLYLKQNAPSDAIVMTWGTHYPTTLAYYSDITALRLEPQDCIDKERPKEGVISWNDTNVMPFYALEDLGKLPEGRTLYILTEEKYLPNLQKKVPVSWQTCGTYGDYLILQIDTNAILSMTQKEDGNE